MTAEGSPTPRVRAVVFDWGGTLTPWHEVDLAEQWRVYAREIHAVPASSGDVTQADLDAAADLAHRILAAEDAAWARGRQLHRSAHLNEVLQQAGLDLDHERHLAALAAYRRFWEPHTHTDPQVRPLWRGLRARGLAVGVLSNTIWSRDYHREVFARDGVLDLIDADRYSSELDHVKPHPAAFEAICSDLQVSPVDAVYVGDRLFEDVHGPHRVGMRAIWIPHSDLPSSQVVDVTDQPDATAESLLDVLSIIDSWTDPPTPGDR